MAESVFTYRVLGGNHRDADGNEYAKGDTFESKDPDLKNKFPNKFKKIDVTDVDIDDEEDIDTNISTWHNGWIGVKKYYEKNRKGTECVNFSNVSSFISISYQNSFAHKIGMIYIFPYLYSLCTGGPCHAKIVHNS